MPTWQNVNQFIRTYLLVVVVIPSFFSSLITECLLSLNVYYQYQYCGICFICKQFYHEDDFRLKEITWHIMVYIERYVLCICIRRRIVNVDNVIQQTILIKICLYNTPSQIITKIFCR